MELVARDHLLLRVARELECERDGRDEAGAAAADPAHVGQPLTVQVHGDAPLHRGRHVEQQVLLAHGAVHVPALEEKLAQRVVLRLGQVLQSARTREMRAAETSK